MSRSAASQKEWGEHPAAHRRQSSDGNGTSSKHRREEASLPAGREVGSAGASVDILGVPVHNLDRTGLNREFERLIREGKRGWVSYVTVHAVNIAQQLPWFREYLASSLVAYCDGEGVRLGSRILRQPLPERVALTYWIYDVCEIVQRNNARIYLLGATDEILSEAVNVLRTLCPRLNIVGTHHGYFDPSQDSKVVDLVNRSAADVLIVGMGMPKQESWIAKNAPRLTTRLIMNSGSCFDFVSGRKPRCPDWMGRMGLEWLFRLMLEPRRLWKRYLIGNPLFVARILRARLHQET